jgi:uncharacterized membrane protein YdjX (TVP38/TMEM64 family)
LNAPENPRLGNAVADRPMRNLGWAVLVGLGAVGLIVWATGGLERFTLSGVAARREAIELFVEEAPTLAILLYVLLFALLTGACLPVALALTLASGAILGPLLGGGATVFGATAGATLTYLATRFVFGAWLAPWVARRPRLEHFVEGARERPFAVMLSARLMPLFPFAPVNVAAGLAGIPLRPYAGATLIGAVPSSFIYSNLGAGLDRTLAAPSAAALNSPAILWPLAGLAVLALAPLAVRGARLRGRRRSSKAPGR